MRDTNVLTGKLVVLKLDGDKFDSDKFDSNVEQQGFRVTLEIGVDGDYPSIEVSGSLPPAPKLAMHLSQWQQSYRSLGVPNRIMPQEIIYGGSVNRLDNCRQFAYTLRDELSQWLESPGFRMIDRRLREVLDLHDTIRVLIRTQNSQLRRLPWHLWDFIERYPKSEIAFSASAFERISLARPASIDKVKNKVKILAILGNSAGINIAADRAVLEHISNADITFLVEPQHQDLSNHLWDQSWDILFFAGHSTTQATQGRIYINAHDSLTLDELRYGLKRAIAQGLQLAIFNSCDGLGLADELEQLNLPQLIVMREPVPDRVAQEFLKCFLTAFTTGESFYLSVRQARERLQGLESEFPCASWLPVIVQNSTEVPPSWQDFLQPLGTQLEAISNQESDRPTLSLRDHLQPIFLASVLVVGVLTGVRLTGVLQPLELVAFDQLMRHRPAEEPDSRLLIITIDDADLVFQDQAGMQRQGSSLSNQALDQVLAKLQPHNPAVIALDIYRPPHQRYGWAHLPQIKSLITVCAIGGGERYPLAVKPPSEIPTQQIGFSNLSYDADNTVRRHLIGMRSDQYCETEESFSYKVAMQYLSSFDVKAEMTNDGVLEMGDRRFPKLEPHTGAYHQPGIGGYETMLNYRASNIAREIPLAQILNNSIDAAVLADVTQNRIVLIGTVDRAAQAYDDFHQTPYGNMPGVIVQAHQISQILSAVQNHRSMIWWLPPLGDVAWIWVWAMLGGTLALRLHTTKLGLGLAVCSATASLGGLCFVILLFGGWMPLIPSAVALAVMIGSTTGWISHTRHNS